MSTDHLTLAGSDAPFPWERLLDRHREEWVSRLMRDRRVVDLATVADPVAAIEAAPEGTGFVLFGPHPAGDGEALRQLLEAAGSRDVPIVVAIEADREGAGQRSAQAAADSVDGVSLVTQELAAGSIIGPPTDDPAVRRRAVHVLVCANVDAHDAGTLVESEAEPLMSGYVAWLEQANRELRKTNARLGREHLGHHDAAAAAIANRRTELEARIAELEGLLEAQRRTADENYERYLQAQWDKDSALQAPRYRLVDSLRDLAFKLPGVSVVLRLRRRRVSRRWGQDS